MKLFARVLKAGGPAIVRLPATGASARSSTRVPRVILGLAGLIAQDLSSVSCDPLPRSALGTARAACRDRSAATGSRSGHGQPAVARDWFGPSCRRLRLARFVVLTAAALPLPALPRAAAAGLQKRL